MAGGAGPDAGFDLDAAQVVRVTSLAPKGKGSLHAALNVKGPRIIVFEIAGVIALEWKSIEIHEPDVFVAGQTARALEVAKKRGGLGWRSWPAK
jgi:hypothetical protein